MTCVFIIWLVSMHLKILTMLLFSFVLCLLEDEQELSMGEFDKRNYLHLSSVSYVHIWILFDGFGVFKLQNE